MVFVGPTPQHLAQFGLKHAARELAAQAGVPLAPGSGLLAEVTAAQRAAARIGYPVMLKSTAGGGGIGLARCNDAAELSAAFDSVQRLGQSYFAHAGVFVERCIEHARHLEVQIFGDGLGQVIALGERDCSLQRRNQKVIEETPAPDLPAAVRQQLWAAAVSLGRSVSYRSAGTVEFIYDPAQQAFYFLEVNTRLQVEHAITESVTGIDLVEWMLLTANGTPPDLSQPVTPQGAALEVRIYAENALRNFSPSPGILTEVSFPPEIRVDGWIETGTEVSAFYDPLLAKLIVHAADRAGALAAMTRALAATRLAGIVTNLDYVRQVIASDGFRAAQVSTRYLDNFVYRPAVVEVLDGGTYTTVQDYPGRVGYWDIGVPPSGPMDDWAFRLANRIVGNPPQAAGIEATVLGPTLRFHGDAVVALCGAPTDADLDGVPVAGWVPLVVKAGQVLRMGKAGSGCRTYLALRYGLDLPLYLGSRATFVLGQFGGHAGRTLRAGDILPFGAPPCTALAATPYMEPAPLPAALVPRYGKTWEIGVLYGPHGAADFFTEASIDNFFASTWEVHYNSNRLGIRLNGPKPQWTRADGGEAGLHPSNIHDCEYAIGSINFTGDMPVILTRDGPSLGGFVCPVTIARAELWKVGQVKPGDTLRFREMSFAAALALESSQDAFISSWDATRLSPPEFSASRGSPILYQAAAGFDHPKTVLRQAGDKYILLEYGENVVDLNLRFRIHALMQALQRAPIAGVLELSPGVRSLQVHYDSRIINQHRLVAALTAADAGLKDIGRMKVPSRILHLPLAYEDSTTLDAVARYRQSVRDTAPWLPSNTEFIRRINGLATPEAVRETLFAASYMVLGLGDVYLGAPCAVPVDPRHRMQTTKYNPARTYTAEGAVGIGGVYMCIYGMDSPGGYQLVGRTLPIWNKFLKNRLFVDGKPWLLRFFDQVRFYPVSETELECMRRDFREGRCEVRIEQEMFDLAEYNAFLAQIEPELATFRAHQKHAVAAEVEYWAHTATPFAATPELARDTLEIAKLPGSLVSADISGSVWKLIASPGMHVSAGDPLLILEAMKMEFHIAAPHDGVVTAFHCEAGMMIHAGDPLASIE
jgi:urea carboxylase